MRFLGTITALSISTTAAIAEPASGAFFGIEFGSASTDFKATTPDMDATSIGIFGGFQGSLGTSSYWNVEGSIAKVDGQTASGNSSQDSFTSITLGAGTYLNDYISVSAFAGFGQAKFTHVTLGQQIDDGRVLGLSVGYDLTEKDKLSLRYYNFDTDGSLEASTSNVVTVRYTRSF